MKKKRGPKPRFDGMTGIAVHLRPEQYDRLQEYTRHLRIGVSAYCRTAIARALDADQHIASPPIAIESSVPTKVDA